MPEAARPSRSPARVGVIACVVVAMIAVGAAPVAATLDDPQRAGDVAVVDALQRSRPLASGDATTVFSLALPDGATCPGDSANEDWRVQSFIVPASDDPATLRYGIIWPEGDGRFALYGADTAPYSHVLTEPNADAGSPARLQTVPPLTFGVYLPGMLPAGRYRVGLACTYLRETARYWDAVLVLTDDATVGAGGFRWTVEGGVPDVAPGEGSSSTTPLLVVTAVVLAAGALFVSRRRARFGALTSVVIVVAAAGAILGPAVTSSPRVWGATNGGPAVVVAPSGAEPGLPLSAGGSATAFTLRLPTGAACSTDSASGDARVQSYMVPASVDVGSLTFGVIGPLPTGTGTAYRRPLVTTTVEPFVNVTTGIATSASEGGQVPTLPNFDFSAPPFASGIVAPGTYNVGIACTRDAGRTLDRYWNVQMTFVVDEADRPSKLRWTVGAPSAATTGATTTTSPSPNTTSPANPGLSPTAATAGGSSGGVTVGGAPDATDASSPTTDAATATTSDPPPTTADAVAGEPDDAITASGTTGSASGLGGSPTGTSLFGNLGELVFSDTPPAVLASAGIALIALAGTAILNLTRRRRAGGPVS